MNWKNRPFKRYRNFQCYLVIISKIKQLLFVFCKHSPPQVQYVHYLKYLQLPEIELKNIKILQLQLSKFPIKALHLEMKILFSRSFLLPGFLIVVMLGTYIRRTCPTTELQILLVLQCRQGLVLPINQSSPRFNVTQKTLDFPNQSGYSATSSSHSLQNTNLFFHLMF